MNVIRIIVAAVCILGATQAQAFTWDFTKFNSAAGVYDAKTFAFDGTGDVYQQLTGGMPTPGNTFRIENILMYGLQYKNLTGAVTGLDKDDVDVNGLSKITITGEAFGHVVTSATNAFSYVYDAINLSLKYDSNLIATTTTLGPSGGSLTDNVWGSGSGTGTYSILAGLDLFESGVMFFNGVDGTSFNGPVALTGGSIRLYDGVTSEWIKNGVLTGFKTEGAGIGGSVQVATPEPASMLLLGSGLIGIYCVRRKSRKS